MGVRRRHVVTKTWRFRIGPRLEPDEPCWFCGRKVDPEIDTGAAELAINPLGDGEPRRGYCHIECAERAKGSLAF